MEESLSKMTFPVAAFKSSFDYFKFYGSKEGLTRVQQLVLKNGWFSHLILVDANLIQYKVVGAKKVKTLGPLVDIILLNPFIRVELAFESETRQWTFEEFQEKVLESIRKDSGYWKSIGYYKGIQSDVQNAKTFDELYRAYARINYSSNGT